MVTVTEADDATTSPTIRVFGGMGLDDRGEPQSIGGPRQQKLLALLALRAGSVVDIDWLAEHLWTDDERPEATIPALRTYVSRLRRAFPAHAQEWIETVPSGYRLSVPDDVVEHQRFANLRAAATEARDRNDPLVAQELLDEALALWRGAPFRELEDVESARPQVEQLGLDRLEMLEERWETSLALGRHTQITGELASFTREHGLRDRAVRQYALALHRSGRTPEALRVLENHRRTVADETGLDPSPAVAELERALLDGDPTLNVESTGRPLRGYRLIEEAGVGAFAVVWRGIQPSVDREVAIKQIRAELASQPEFIRRFEAEAHLVARIEHPHIVPLIDFWRDPDSAYLVMRWLRGGTLERRLDDGPLSVSETLGLAHQIGGALSAAHAHGVIHRDVKTGNILFDEAGHAFLGDFGIALEAAESAGPEAALSPGSPAYSAPEQIRREPLGPEADVFSLGVVVFECLTGSLPFAALSARDLVDRQLHEPYPALAELRADVPTSVSDAVARATAKDPSERFASVAEFLDALEPAAAVVDASPVFDGEFENPYVGLQAFDDADVDRFFGRERLVSELLDRLAGDTIRSRCLLVVGPSGSGKSSVVRAGLVPALRTGRVDGSDEWFTTTMVPGADPFEGLEAALLRIAVNPPPTLLDQLRDGSRGILRSVRRCLGADDDRLLLVIDQFEELFAGSSAEDAGAFLDALAVAVAEPTSPLRLVATLRADFYDRPLAHPTFAPVLKETAVDVTPLAPDELERAIVEPARRQGVAFEPGLVARIAAEANGQPSPLPLLQYALSELFDRRDSGLLSTTAYDELGGLSGALAARAESIHDSADPERRIALRRVFGSMTDPDAGTTDLRRRVPVADLGGGDGADWVLEQLGRARLVTFDRDVTTREPTVEVAHEALLREWPRLVEWLREDAALLRSVGEVGRAAATWNAGGREPSDLYRGGRLETALGLMSAAAERLRPVDRDFVEASRAAAEEERQAEVGRVKRLRRLVVAVALALVVALIAGGIAVVQQRRADDEARAAGAAAAEAEAQTAVALAAVEDADYATIISRSGAIAADDPVAAVLLALEAHRRRPGPESYQAVLNALRTSEISARTATFDPLYDVADNCPDVSFMSTDGFTDFATVGGQMVSRDLDTGLVTEHGPPPEACALWKGNATAGRRWATATPPLRMYFGPFDGPWEVEKDFDELTFLIRSAFLSNRLVFVSGTLGDTLITVLDATNGEEIATVEGSEYLDAQVSADGAYIAVGLARPGRPGGDGYTVVLDAETGEEVFAVDTRLPTNRIAFDTETNEVLLAQIGGGLLTVDLGSGEITNDVATSASSEFLSIRVRDDGLVVSVTQGGIELIDRATGPIGEPTEIRDAIGARIRADGTVIVATTNEQDEIYRPGQNALVEQSWAVEPFSLVVIGETHAATLLKPTDDVELIELATGERTVVVTDRADGDPFRPLAAWPGTGPGEFWAISLDSIVARWEGLDIVEQIDLGVSTRTGNRVGDAVALIGERDDGRVVAQRVALIPGATAVSLEVDVSATDAITALPSSDGGMHVLDSAGTIFTYDVSGALVGELPTGEGGGSFRVDPATGRFAIGADDGVVIVDPVTGEILHRIDERAVNNLGFAQDGRSLVIVAVDGTVRLWDLEREALVGVLWDGSGTFQAEAPRYDAETDSIWVASSGEILNLPLDPNSWVETACDIVGRDLTAEEWERLVPGDEPPKPSC